MQVGGGICVDFNDGNDGFKKYMGMGANVKASFTVNNGALNVNFSDVDWVGKIVAFLVGWFLCWIPWVTCAIGLFKQLEFPKKIGNDIQMLVSGGQQFNAQPQWTNCPKCGAAVEPGAQFCPGCGEKVR